MTTDDIKAFVKSLHLRVGTVVDVQDVTGEVSKGLIVESVTVLERVGIIGVSFADKRGRQMALPWSSIVAIMPKETSK